MRYILVVLVFFLNACSVKNYTHTTTKIVILKTPKIKFSDIAYIRSKDDALEIELFIAGQIFKKIEINHLICVDNEGCTTKTSFNEHYLNSSYPKDILKKIFLGKKIYNNLHLNKTENGFIQTIQNKYVDIIYKKSDNMIYFKDRKNHILIKIKDI